MNAMVNPKCLDSDYVKACCTAVYESEWTKLLLGDSFHPGGMALTERLGTLLKLKPSDHVLDVAAGQGRSTIHLAQTFGCCVTGVEYGKQAVEIAKTAVSTTSLSHLITIEQGDAEALPFANGRFDALICECAFCTFPNKKTAAFEFARVLKPDGRIGISDITRDGTLPTELAGLMAWIACIADAQPIAGYLGYLENAGFENLDTERHDQTLAELVRSVQAKLFGVELMVKLDKLTLPELDFDQAKQIAHSAGTAVRQGKLGYALIHGKKAANT
ncbi:MAG: class I SAM-dependent methyltransferase [Chloroflexi bacterium]|nr:MAG: class I SAM-dependent methyltransferase [Chloroflexota bacterium]